MCKIDVFLKINFFSTPDVLISRGKHFRLNDSIQFELYSIAADESENEPIFIPRGAK